MPNNIDKKTVTIDEATDSKSLQKLSDKELQRMLDTLLCDDSDNDVTVNVIIAELAKRGHSKEDVEADTDKKKEKIEKAFEALNLNLIEKSKGPWKKGKKSSSTPHYRDGSNTMSGVASKNSVLFGEKNAPGIEEQDKKDIAAYNKKYPTFEECKSEFEVRDCLGGDVTEDFDADLKRAQKTGSTFSKHLHDKALQNTMQP
jgi:hypothetical protein